MRSRYKVAELEHPHFLTCTTVGWLPVFTNTTPTNMLFYTDPDAGSYPGRFYRAYQFP